ncbi:branched-chain amino acid ABC transporter permease/ATP-binding protein [Nocardia sp. NBC_00565]|uniref:branched-chain amino acid ABC transporter permease/ATP-binding protein n=1 Tax=Nocardia sp. NBC_00565 TaxID=2975993 RepID=UPI002E81EB86|nr:branched-chain amino acid ABC transporter permease/ATP-binding protein [Nocardia sp. NBC_00565]WUC05712.1 branched-chain amino acid ABC transporter permease/ATP-binding protein [Nocardia sp. NBC_00565]
MTEVWRFAALGLGAGALYALAAIGLVLVYRGSGVVNFAQGAMGMVGAYVYFEARQEHGLAQPVSVLLGLLASALLGALFHVLILRRMHHASALAKIVATLALLVVLQSTAVLRYGPLPKVVPSMLPIEPVAIFGAQIGEDRVYILLIVVALAAVLWLIYRFTAFGIATSAVAENPRAAAALAVSPNLIAAANWAIGSALGAMAAILLVPITGLGTANLTYLVIPVSAAAVVGRFSSFPVTVLAGLVIGVAQSEVTRYVTEPGWGTAVPFVLIAIVLLARGKAIAGKDEKFGRMPRLGTGRIAKAPLLVAAAVVLLCIWALMPTSWVNALQAQLLGAIIVMSFVVVTGYAGQLSLMQVGFGGIGALMAGWLVATHGWPFEVALIAGVLAAVPVGIVVGLAGVRTRGVYLAILTLGLAISLEAVVFMNPEFAGGVTGYNVGDTTVFGINVNGLFYPKRYATFALVILVLVGLAIANLRRSRAGRRLIAVRTNERAAAALGVSVLQAKLYAFVLGGMIAALGGIMVAFRSPVLQFTNFAGLQSVAAMQNAVLGGAGTLAGPLVGSGFGQDSLGQQIFSFLGAEVALYIALVSGVGLLFMLTIAPDGLAFQLLPTDRAKAMMSGPFGKRLRRGAPKAAAQLPVTDVDVHRVAPKSLELHDVSVRFGGVTALKSLALQVQPGEIVGLIGPNGAGKSTAIDAITGFAVPATGAVYLDGQNMTGWSRERRARAGLGRSFQSLELFDDLTVRENLQTACDRRDMAAYATNLVVPDRAELSPAALAAVADFDLRQHLETKASDLDYARRRMLAVARAVAGGHSVLLLDEPASGLGEPQTRHLGEVLRRLAAERGMAILLVEHNIDMVLRTCDRVYALDFGVLIGQGTPAEIRNNPAVIEAYLGTSRFTADNAAAQLEQQARASDPAGSSHPSARGSVISR